MMVARVGLHRAPEGRRRGSPARIARLAPRRLVGSRQVVLPKTLRDKRGWVAGAEFTVGERPEGVLLRAAPKKELS